MAYELIWQLNKVLFVLKSRLDGPLACLVRRLAHFPNSMLDGPTGVPGPQASHTPAKLYKCDAK
jgi:hypothetical protein